MRTTPFEDFLYEETSIRVAEEVGPNCIDYDRVHDKLMDDEVWCAQVRAAWIAQQNKEPANDPVW